MIVEYIEMECFDSEGSSWHVKVFDFSYQTKLPWIVVDYCVLNFLKSLENHY